MPPRRTETTRKPLTINPMVVALFLAVMGWVGLAYLLTSVHPTLPAKAALLALWAAALMGTAWPVLLAIHRRFRGEPALGTVWRQSAWVAIFGLASAWLQMNRLLNITWAAILAGMLVVLEVILSTRAQQGAHDDD